MNEEVYVSIDVETDGRIPGPSSMLSLGAVALYPDKTIISTFSVNLETLPGATGDRKTLEWWSKQKPEIWAEHRRNTKAPEVAMKEFNLWLKKLPRGWAFAAYPAGYDFTFVYWYLCRFLPDENSFRFSCVDIKTLAMREMNCAYSQAIKRNMPKRWFDPLPHTHVALDDALEQGMLFCNILNESRRKR
jgi:DNA polymerase III alpha subunit (gram-positive type)